MNWGLVEAQLADAATRAPRQFGEATIVMPFETPFPLWQVVEDAFTEDEADEHGSLEDWPGGVQELLGAEDALLSLLSFSWGGAPGGGSEAGLDIVGRGTRRYLCWWDEIESYRAFVAIEPWDDDLAMSAIVASFIATNGEEYGLGAFGGPPDEITNYQPQLVSQVVLRQAFFDFHQLDWWEGQDQFDEWFKTAAL